MKLLPIILSLAFTLNLIQIFASTIINQEEQKLQLQVQNQIQKVQSLYPNLIKGIKSVLGNELFFENNPNNLKSLLKPNNDPSLNNLIKIALDSETTNDIDSLRKQLIGIFSNSTFINQIKKIEKLITGSEIINRKSSKNLIKRESEDLSQLYKVTSNVLPTIFTSMLWLLFTSRQIGAIFNLLQKPGTIYLRGLLHAAYIFTGVNFGIAMACFTVEIRQNLLKSIRLTTLPGILFMMFDLLLILIAYKRNIPVADLIPFMPDDSTESVFSPFIDYYQILYDDDYINGYPLPNNSLNNQENSAPPAFK